MILLQDGVLAFLSAVGVTTLFWIVGGALFHAGINSRFQCIELRSPFLIPASMDPISYK